MMATDDCIARITELVTALRQCRWHIFYAQGENGREFCADCGNERLTPHDESCSVKQAEVLLAQYPKAK